MDWLYIQSMVTILNRIQLENQRNALIEQLRSVGNLMRGSLVKTKVRCGRKGCVCETGEKHEKVHLSLTLQGRTRGCYVGRGREEAVASLINEYQRAWHIIEQLTEINLELLRGDHPGGQKRNRKR
jgi:hypothetical protein